MKKFYSMMAVCAAMSMPMSAQVEMQEAEQPQDAALLQEQVYHPSKVIRRAENDATKAGGGYEKPLGAFWIGLSENRYGYGTTQHMIVPPFAELNFEAIVDDGNTHLWEYVNPEREYSMFNPMLESTEKNLSLTYNYTDQTQIEAPKLTLSGDGLSDSVFMENINAWAIYMHVGRREFPGSTAAGNYTFGNHPRGKVYWFNTSYFNSTSFTPNSANFQSTWLSTYKSWYGSEVEALNVKGIGERFDKPLAPITLKELWCYGQRISGSTIDSDMRMTIRDYDGNLLAYAICPKEDVPNNTGTTLYSMVGFKNLYDAYGNPIEYLVLDDEFYVFWEPQDNTTTYAIYYYRAPWFGGDDIYTYTISDITYDGEQYENWILDAGGVYDDNTCQKSFNIYLQYSYEWMHGDITEYAAPATGGTATVNIDASMEYLTYMERMPNWQVTLEDGSLLPDWITLNVTDNFDSEYEYQRSSVATLQVAALPAGVESREATVQFEYHGAKHLVKITQNGTTNGIDQIDTDANTDDAPAYNLAGQRVNENTTGVIIKGGKKVIKK